MDPVLLTELAAAVAEAKHRARGALLAFGQQPLPVAVREAATFLSYRLDDIDTHHPALAREPLLHVSGNSSTRSPARAAAEGPGRADNERSSANDGRGRWRRGRPRAAPGAAGALLRSRSEPAV